MKTSLINNLESFYQEARIELLSILEYWLHNTVDETHGGFYGEINDKNTVHPLAEKSLVLNSRILWTFSAAYQFDPKPLYLNMAHRAYDYLIKHFMDAEFGGCYWTVDYLGRASNSRKQIYGQAFAIYSLSEYYRAVGKPEACEKAQELFGFLEQFGWDKQHGGYIEALSREWGELEDVRLSAKDANEKKSMNTHLHVLEAYTNLYRIWPNPCLDKQIRALLRLYETRLVDVEGQFQHLFLDENWQVKSHAISFGHDIEASWLIWEAAEVLDNPQFLERIKPLVLGLAYSSQKGVAMDGGMNYELDLRNQKLDTHKYAWVQAEAVVGYFNAYEISGNPVFLEYSHRSWEFIQKFIKDRVYGEWYWGVNVDYFPLEDLKVGFWKCPYHNSRACLEMLRRLPQHQAREFSPHVRA